MKTVQILTLLSLAAPAFAATDLKVDVYEGPKECEDGSKVKAGDFLSMHYTGTIDESSETGEKGKKFDSSVDRGQTFDFQIGIGQVIKGCKYTHRFIHEERIEHVAADCRTLEFIAGRNSCY